MGNNEEGVTGVNWNVKIMILKVACWNPEEGKYIGYYSSDIVKALEYATDKGVLISNHSYGGHLPSSSIYDAIQEAQDDGHLFIASAGNDSRDVDEYPEYPACYDLENIISVASSDDSDFLSSFSNWGANSVDLAAPGGQGFPNSPNDIYSTIPNDNYAFKHGTSMSAPHVAGVAALILSCRPDLGWEQVKDAIMTSVDPKSTHSGKTVTGGRLNAYEALFVFPPIPEAPSDFSAYPTAYDQIDLSWQDNSNVEEGYKIERGTSPTQFSVIATEETPCGTFPMSYKDGTCSMGTTYYYRVRAYNPNGYSSYSNTKRVYVPPY